MSGFFSSSLLLCHAFWRSMGFCVQVYLLEVYCFSYEAWSSAFWVPLVSDIRSPFLSINDQYQQNAFVIVQPPKKCKWICIYAIFLMSWVIMERKEKIYLECLCVDTMMNYGISKVMFRVGSYIYFFLHLKKDRINNLILTMIRCIQD